MDSFVEPEPNGPGATARPGSRWSQHIGAAAVSLLIAMACFAASIPFGDFQMEATMMGKDYELMSLHPLRSVGPHPERFLSPLFAWLLGLSGSRYWLFSHGMLLLFLALAQHLTWMKSKDRVWATAFTFGIAISATAATYRGLVGYSDPLTFCLLALSIALLQRRAAFWVLLGLGLLNHGQNLFLWPWLVYERARVARLDWRDAVGAAVGIGVYFGARTLLVSDAPTAGAGSFSGASLSIRWYLEHLDWPRAIDLWILILPGLAFCFGAQLVVLFWDVMGPRRRERWIALSLLMVAIAAILVIAIDIYRFVALLTFLMLVAMHRRLVPTPRSRAVLVATVLATLAIRQPQIDLVSFLMQRMTESAMQGEASPVLRGVLPTCWPAFVGYAAFLAVLAAVAAWALPRFREDGLPAHPSN